MHLNFIRDGRGTTHNLVCNKKNVLHFNPRPREGDDADIPALLPRHIYFNPRPREGDDSGCVPFHRAPI